MCDLFARAIRKHSFANPPPLQLLSANQNFANAQTHLRILLKLQYKYAQTAPQIFISNSPTFKFSNNQSSPSLISKLRSLGEARHPEGRGPGPRPEDKGAAQRDSTRGSNKQGESLLSTAALSILGRLVCSLQAQSASCCLNESQTSLGGWVFCWCRLLQNHINCS
jgi:hypothetical protein